MDNQLNGGELLLAEIRRDLTEPPPDAVQRMRHAVQNATLQSANVSAAGLRHGRAGRRSLRPALAGVAAIGVAAAVGAGVVVGSSDRGAQRAPDSTIQAQPSHARPSDAPMLLREVSWVTDRTSVSVRDDQFIYTEMKVRSILARRKSDGQPTTIDDDSQYWESADGSKPGWNISADKRGHRQGGPTAANPEPNLESPTYKYLTTLPTDPDVLLARIRAAVAQTEGSKPDAVVDMDQAAFTIIGDLVRHGPLPPALGAALYRAAAQIPGVQLVPDAVDAAGRHGIGVVRRSTALAALPSEGGTQSRLDPVYEMEWIFDAKTYSLLGTRTESRAATISVAVIERAVVDRVRDTKR
ncbi:CU044_5270 family protein [Cryptosporangium aurantiacum]|uniref:CU044_5270 family protein n=1 Tax=Cryptosporangium aurantiacum TaxID=134849 RepID=A0A1M7RN37_9ACTN|nr:CU044_5270 family protein [Cryptosporangium aurantiacum]SHN47664.1 hypothetical protein SAMN05443668_12646 [Cryptosporangium aurantiacum]